MSTPSTPSAQALLPGPPQCTSFGTSANGAVVSNVHELVWRTRQELYMTTFCLFILVSRPHHCPRESRVQGRTTLERLSCMCERAYPSPNSFQNIHCRMTLPDPRHQHPVEEPINSSTREFFVPSMRGLHHKPTITAFGSRG